MLCSSRRLLRCRTGCPTCLHTFSSREFLSFTALLHCFLQAAAAQRTPKFVILAACTLPCHAAFAHACRTNSQLVCQGAKMFSSLALPPRTLYRLRLPGQARASDGRWIIANKELIIADKKLIIADKEWIVADKEMDHCRKEMDNCR